jgi:predicted RNase H-like HicB family nuclease
MVRWTDSILSLCLEDYTEGMKFRVVIEYDPVAEAYSSVCPELPGCASAGVTEEEARENIREAIALYLAPSDLPTHCARLRT